MPFKDAERQRRAVRDSQRRARLAKTGHPARETKAPVLPALKPLRFRTAKDILTALDAQVAAVSTDNHLSTIERARGVAMLAGVALRAFEIHDLAERLDRLEREAPRKRGAE